MVRQYFMLINLAFIRRKPGVGECSSAFSIVRDDRVGEVTDEGMMTAHSFHVTQWSHSESKHQPKSPSICLHFRWICSHN